MLKIIILEMHIIYQEHNVMYYAMQLYRHYVIQIHFVYRHPLKI